MILITDSCFMNISIELFKDLSENIYVVIIYNSSLNHIFGRRCGVIARLQSNPAATHFQTVIIDLKLCNL